LIHGALARLCRVVEVVRRDARTQITDSTAGIAAGEHVDDEVEFSPAETVVRVARADVIEQIIQVPGLDTSTCASTSRAPVMG